MFFILTTLKQFEGDQPKKWTKFAPTSEKTKRPELPRTWYVTPYKKKMHAVFMKKNLITWYEPFQVPMNYFIIQCLYLLFSLPLFIETDRISFFIYLIHHVNFSHLRILLPCILFQYSVSPSTMTLVKRKHRQWKREKSTWET